MNKLIAATFLALFSIASHAQSSSWSMTEVPSANKSTAGYIYHTYARGTVTQNGTKSYAAAGLRFVCSAKGKGDPIVAVFWNGLSTPVAEQKLEIIVDKIALLRPTWMHDGSIIFSTVATHPDLLSAMKRGRTVRITWDGPEASKYTVIFDLKDFNLTEFNSSCKTNL